jgi:hypothetical protein
LGELKHNEVIREITAENTDKVAFIDMERLIGKDGANFVDICHLSRSGRDLFAASVKPVAEQMAMRTEGSH